MTFQEVYKSYPQHREEMDERAGKMEFDNELSRENAEAETAVVMHERYLLFKHGSLFNGGRY